MPPADTSPFQVAAPTPKIGAIAFISAPGLGIAIDASWERAALGARARHEAARTVSMLTRAFVMTSSIRWDIVLDIPEPVVDCDPVAGGRKDAAARAVFQADSHRLLCVALTNASPDGASFSAAIRLTTPGVPA
jgi:hypothetical protein